MQPNDEAVQRDRPRNTPSDISADRPRPSAVLSVVDVRTKKRRRRWLLLAVILFVLAVWAWAGYYTSCPVPVNPIIWHEAAARREVAAALPLGSTRQQVLAWLQAKGIQHDVVENPQCGIIMIAAGKPYAWLFDRGRVIMEFYFDCAGKLIDEKVRIWVVSL